MASTIISGESGARLDLRGKAARERQRVGRRESVSDDAQAGIQSLTDVMLGRSTWA